MKNELKEGPGQGNLISLTFIVNGQEVVIEKVNLNQPLKVAVEKALTESGNSGRPISDWLVKWLDKTLNINDKVGDFNFPADVKLFISLKSGQGGKC